MLWVRQASTRVLLLGLVGCLAACSPAKRDAISMLNAGVKRFELEDYDTAYGHFKRSVEIYPENSRAYYHLGLIDLHQRQELGLARQHLERASQLDPKDKDVLLNLGRLAYVEEKFDEARKHLEAALALDQNFALAFYFKGEAALSQNRFEDADKAWRESIAIRPTDARPFLSLAEMYLRFEAFAEAAAVYREGLRHNPNHVDLLEGIGVMQLLANKVKMAIESFKNVISRSPTREESLYNLAFAFMRDDQPNEALTYLNAYLDNTAHKRGPDRRAAQALLEVVQTHIE